FESGQVLVGDLVPTQGQVQASHAGPARPLGEAVTAQLADQLVHVGGRFGPGKGCVTFVAWRPGIGRPGASLLMPEKGQLPLAAGQTWVFLLARGAVVA